MYFMCSEIHNISNAEMNICKTLGLWDLFICFSFDVVKLATLDNVGFNKGNKNTEYLVLLTIH